MNRKCDDMTEKELNRVRNLKKKIEREAERVAGTRRAITDLVPFLDGMPHAQNQSSRVEKLTAQIVDGERRLDELKDEMAAEAAALTAEISRAPLNRQEHDVIMLRYVTCLNFRDIEFRLNYSDANVFYHHRNGTKKLFGKIPFDSD